MAVEELHKKHFHELYTDRLSMRPLQLADAEAMFEYTSVPENFRFLRREPHISVEEDRIFIQSVLNGYRQHREFVWGICLHSEDHVIGTCRLFDFHFDEMACEVSYLIHPTLHGCGIATEAVTRLIQYAFKELAIQKVHARCVAQNIGSARVMQKCGMRLEKNLPHYSEQHGVWQDFLLYSITTKGVTK